MNSSRSLFVERLMLLLTGDIVARVLGSIFLKFAGILLGLLATVILTRFMGAESFGLYIFAYIVVRLLALPMQSGIGPLITRECARLQLTEQWSDLRGLLTRGLQAVSLYSVLIIAIGCCFLFLQKENLSKTEFNVYLLALILLPFIGWGSYSGAALVGFRRVVWGQTPEVIIKPLCFVFLIVFAYELNGARLLDASIGMFLNLVATIVAVIVGIILMFRYLPKQIYEVQKTARLQNTWIRSVLPFTIIAGANAIYLNIDILMLGILKDYEDVGLYRVATRGAVLISLSLYALNSAIGPYIVRFNERHEMYKLQKLLSIGSMLMLLGSAPLFFAYLLYGESILSFVFGEEFSKANMALIILGGGQLINVVFGSVALVLNMTGHEMDTAKGSVFAALLNCLLNYPFIIMWGIEGAAVATAISLVSVNIFQGVRLYKTTGLVTLAIPFFLLKQPDFKESE